jgi:hypothetical protein
MLSVCLAQQSLRPKVLSVVQQLRDQSLLLVGRLLTHTRHGHATPGIPESLFLTLDLLARSSSLGLSVRV